jgi:hypothetical protein
LRGKNRRLETEPSDQEGKISMKNQNKSGLVAAALLSLTSFGAKEASAVVMVDIVEDGTDVVATFDGTIDLTGLDFAGNSVIPSGMVNPSRPLFYSMTNGWYAYDFAATMTAFGSGGRTIATSQTGQSFGLEDRYVYVPIGYTSGDSINGSMTFESASFASLGMTEGSYTTVFPNGEEVILTVGATVVPLPASLPLLVAGLGGLGLAARRKSLRDA